MSLGVTSLLVRNIINRANRIATASREHIRRTSKEWGPQEKAKGKGPINIITPPLLLTLGRCSALKVGSNEPKIINAIPINIIRYPSFNK
ncbi:MAG: hypothetical protein B6U69_00400 [Thermofilum sp. ex4484_15]|nr:MAG: hypothetical protein B6U69_00400 [Thermofilum sp. ex4484_15]